MRPFERMPDTPTPVVPLDPAEAAIESQRREDGTFRCTKTRRIPLYRIEQVELAPSGTVPMRDIGTTDLRCIHEQGHQGPHLGYYYGLRIAWPYDDG